MYFMSSAISAQILGSASGSQPKSSYRNRRVPGVMTNRLGCPAFEGGPPSPLVWGFREMEPWVASGSPPAPPLLAVSGQIVTPVCTGFLSFEVALLCRAFLLSAAAYTNTHHTASRRRDPREAAPPRPRPRRLEDGPGAPQSQVPPPPGDSRVRSSASLAGLPAAARPAGDASTSGPEGAAVKLGTCHVCVTGALCPMLRDDGAGEQ